jgi:hypothetical protein
MKTVRIILIGFFLVGVVTLSSPDVAHALTYPPYCGPSNDGETWVDPETGVLYTCDGATGKFRDAYGRPHPFYASSEECLCPDGGRPSGVCGGHRPMYGLTTDMAGLLPAGSEGSASN